MSELAEMLPSQTGNENKTSHGGSSTPTGSLMEFPWQGSDRKPLRDAMYRSVSEGLELIPPASSEPEFGPFAGKVTVPEVFFEPIEISLKQPLMIEKDLDLAEEEAMRRETEIRAAASPELAAKLSSDDDAWRGYNSLRHTLIEKELSSGLSHIEKAILGTLELLSDRRIREENRESLAKAKELLARIEEDSN